MRLSLPQAQGVGRIPGGRAKLELAGLDLPHTLSTLRFSGPTVHFVDEEFDTGAILAQVCDHWSAWEYIGV